MNFSFIIIGAILFICFLLPVFSHVLNAGNIVGMALGAAFLYSGISFESMSFSAKKWFCFIMFIALFLIIVASIYIMDNGKSTAKNEKVIIVLGCRVRGAEPSLALIKRVDSAYNHLLCNPDAVAVLSGGQGRDEYISEALCMKQMLCDRGISSQRLFLEDKSTNTDENIAFSAEIIKREGLVTDVAVVSSEYHICRAKKICLKYDLNAEAISSHTRLDLLPTFLLREAMALAKTIIK